MSRYPRNLSVLRIRFRASLPTIIACGLLTACLSTETLFAQVAEAERESMTEPVYRPSEGAEAATAAPEDPAASSDSPAIAESSDRLAGLPSTSSSSLPPNLPPAIPAPSLGAAPEPATSPAPPSQETKVALASPHHSQASPSPSGIAASQDPLATMEMALRDAEQMLQHIQQDVRDYTCILIKRENVRGTVLPTEFIKTKVRNRRIENGVTVTPFSVYMKFLKPDEYKGREVLFVEDQRNGLLLVKEGGFKGRLLPSVSLKPTGRFAMQENRYPISEVGIENLTRRLLDRSRDETNLESCKVTYRDGAKINGRPCKVLEVRRETPKTGEAAKKGMNVYLAQVFMDSELNIPIRYGAYDWPESPGDEPEVVEEYTYHDLKINVGLCDEDFSAENRKYGF